MSQHTDEPYFTLWPFENEAEADCGCRMEKSNRAVRFYFCRGHAAETERLKIVAELEHDK